MQSVMSQKLVEKLLCSRYETLVHHHIDSSSINTEKLYIGNRDSGQNYFLCLTQLSQTSFTRGPNYKKDINFKIKLMHNVH